MSQSWFFERLIPVCWQRLFCQNCQKFEVKSELKCNMQPVNFYMKILDLKASLIQFRCCFCCSLRSTSCLYKYTKTFWMLGVTKYELYSFPVQRGLEAGMYIIKMQQWPRSLSPMLPVSSSPACALLLSGSYVRMSASNLQMVVAFLQTLWCSGCCGMREKYSWVWLITPIK